jgi:hypothetical protein
MVDPIEQIGWLKLMVDFHGTLLVGRRVAITVGTASRPPRLRLAGRGRRAIRLNITAPGRALQLRNRGW